MGSVLMPGAIPAYATGGDDGTAGPDTYSAYTFETAEIVTTGVVFTVLFASMLVMIYAMIRARTFRPLRAKQPVLMFLCLIAGTCMIAGSMLANRVFPVDENIHVAVCIVVIGWLYVPFGVFFFIIVYIYRLYRLFLIFKRTRLRHASTFYKMLPMVAFVMPPIILAVVYTALGWVNLAPTKDLGKPVCYSYDPFIYSSFALAFVYIVPMGIVGYILRKVPLKHFNEYKRLVTSMIASLVLWLASLVISISGFQHNIIGRCLIPFIYLVMLMFVVFVQMGPAIFYSIYDPLAYEAAFNEEVRRGVAVNPDSSSNTGSRTGKSSQLRSFKSSAMSGGGSSMNAAEIISELESTPGKVVEMSPVMAPASAEDIDEPLTEA